MNCFSSSLRTRGSVGGYSSPLPRWDRKARERVGGAVVPGCHTPTGVLAAHRAGAPLQKLFPAPGIGPAYVRACLGPLPFLKIVPTHNVDAANARAWLEAGAHAVGFTQSLFDAA